MIKKINRWVLIGSVLLTAIIILFGFSELFPQERLKLYIINEELGKLINVEERNFLGLYTEVGGFRYAAFFMREDGSYGARILYYENEEMKISERNYTDDEIQTLSRYIDRKFSEMSVLSEKVSDAGTPKVGLLVAAGEKIDFEGNGIGYGINLGLVGGDYFSVSGGYSRITFEGKNKANVGLSFRTSFYPDKGDEESFAGFGARFNRTFKTDDNPGEDIDSGELYLDFGCNIKISDTQIFFIKLSPTIEYILKEESGDKTSGGIFVTLGFLFH